MYTQAHSPFVFRPCQSSIFHALNICHGNAWGVLKVQGNLTCNCKQVDVNFPIVSEHFLVVFTPYNAVMKENSSTNVDESFNSRFC